MAESIPTLILGILWTGLLPALIWLWFWLHEDPHPEPQKKLISSFGLGMAAVPIALALEYVWYEIAVSFGIVAPNDIASLVLLFPFEIIEELAKFIFAWKTDLNKSIFFDEPVDAMIYLITVALGFSALENMLFLAKTFHGGTAITLATAGLRFFGATILHTITAAVMGASVAVSFFHKEHKWRNIIGGIALAIVLHTLFNTFIINSGTPVAFLQTFFAVWTLALFLPFIFERVKRLRK